MEEQDIDFPRPRSIETTFTPEFSALTQRLREAIVAVRAQRSEVAA